MGIRIAFLLSTIVFVASTGRVWAKDAAATVETAAKTDKRAKATVVKGGGEAGATSAYQYAYGCNANGVVVCKCCGELVNNVPTWPIVMSDASFCAGKPRPVCRKGVSTK